MPHLRSLLRVALSLLLCLAAIVSVGSAQNTANATGSITGRVLGSSGDSFLERVRVTVAGTAIEAFTDDAGFYRLDAVPAGPARVTLFYSGMAPHVAVVNVTSGETARHDATLASTVIAPPRSAESVVKLDAYVVETSR